ncbi:hypothetical protein VA596_23445 [Amycolatopsis sp., V23-08]|uniref:DUF2550 family protein n=1 Tax=Amycolatopsis heterodermiae TaxID=3110235 RepID=A0ABU5RB88_9PSEU|nr:hypothetical protein [Amycolatopsis sp., V23-08]MEA5362511.1 hypothetical protein [Amycolatopsis sp., V23-08]
MRDEEIGLLVFLGLGVIMMIIRFRWREKFEGFGRVPPPDPAYASQFAVLRDEDYDLVLRGAATVNHLKASGPVFRLLVSRGQAELRVSGAEPVRIVRAEVTGLEWVGPFGRGFRFHTASGRLDKVTVWPQGTAGEQLAELGWR